MLTLHLVSAILACTQAVFAQSATITSSGSPTSTAVTPGASEKPLGEGEILTTQITYIASLTSLVTTTYTITTTSETAITRPTGLAESLYCNNDFVNGTYPFCYPYNGTQQIKGKKYSATWNYLYGESCAKAYVALNYFENINSQQVDSIDLPNALGFWNYTVKSEWLNGKSSQFAQFALHPYECNGTVEPALGPIIEFLKKRPTTEEKGTSKDTILGLSIGLPLALAAFVGVALFVMWWNKGHRTIPIFKKKGYTGRKHRAVRLQDLGQQQGETYRDHPSEA